MSQEEFDVKIRAEADESSFQRVEQRLDKLKNQNVKVNVSSNSEGVDKLNNSVKHTAKTANTLGDNLKNALNISASAAVAYKAINMVTGSVNKAFTAVKDIDDAIVQLRYATNKSYDDVSKLINHYNQMGQTLGATTTEVSDSANTWLRQGKTLQETNTLIKDSMMLSKIAGLNSSDATEYLTSAMKGYKVSVEDTIKIVDKLTAVDLVSATDTGGLAESMSQVAVTASNAGISMDKLLGYLAATGEVTQESMKTIGTSFKTIFTRMSDIKSGKLELIDEDGTTEILSDVEQTLANVGIDLRKTLTEYNNYGDVLDNLAAKWDSLSQVQQNALAKAFAGTRQQNRFRVLMENYDNAKSYAETASNSIGTAEEKFSAYADTIESKLNSLQSAFENLAINNISTDMINSVVEATTSVVRFLDKTNLLNGSIKGLAIAGAITLFTKLSSSVKTTALKFSNLGEAMTILKGNIGTEELNNLIALTSGLSKTQLKAVLSSKSLNNEQRMSILMARGLSEAEAAAQLKTLGLTTQTISLKSAMKGLWATIKANPLMIAVTAITAISSIYDSYTQSQEEAKEKADEANSAIVEEAKSIEEKTKTLEQAVIKYQQYSSKTNMTAEDENEFKQTIQDVTSALGDKSDELEGLTVKTNEYADAIKNASKAELEEAQNQAKKGATAAASKLSNNIKNVDNLHGYTLNTGLLTNNNTPEEIEQASAELDILQKYIVKIGELQGGTIHNWNYGLKPSSNETSDVLSYYYNLIEIQDEYLNKFDETTLKNSENYQTISNAISDMSKYVDDYIEQEYSLLKYQYEIANGIPTTVDEYNQMKDSILKNASANNELSKSYEKLLKNDIGEIIANTSKKADNSTDEVQKSFYNKIELIKKTLSDLWENDSFKTTKNKLIKSANTLAGITAKDINDLANENSSLNIILNDTGMSAEYLANIFEDIAKNGTSAIDTLSIDGLKINEILSEITDKTNEARQAYEDYNSAIEGGDYNDFFANYQKAYESLGEMFKNGQYGEKFYRTVQYLFGEGHSTEKLDKLYERYKNLSSLFGYDDNGLGFIEELNKHQDELSKLKSSVTQNSDGSFDFDIKTDEFSQIADILGITEEAVTSCVEALGMYGDFNNYDNQDLLKTFSELSVTLKDTGDNAIISKGKLEELLKTLGYEQWQIEQIVADTEKSKEIKLLDFDDTSRKNVEYILNSLKENINFTDKNIDITSFGNTLKNAMGMSNSEIKSFMKTLDNLGYKFIDGEKAYKGYGSAFKSAIKNMTSTSELLNTIDDLDKLKSKAKKSQETLNKLYDNDKNWKKLNIDFDKADKDDIETVQKIVDDFKNENGIVDVSVEGATEAQSILAALIKQKQELEKPNIMKVNASKITGDGSLSTAMKELQNYYKNKQDFDLKTAIGVDTTESKKKLNQSIKNIKEDTNFTDVFKFDANVDFSKLNNKEIQKKLNDKIAFLNESNEALVSIGVDTSAIDGYKAKDKKATLTYAVDETEVKSFLNSNHDTSAKLEYTIYVNGEKYSGTLSSLKTQFSENSQSENKVTYHQSTDGSIGGIDKHSKMGSLSKSVGRSYAGGTNNRKIGDNGVALGGELGAELRVNTKTGEYQLIGQNSAEFFEYNKDDLIFSAEQTKQLLNNGAIYWGKKRGTIVGHSYSNGNISGRAFISGSVPKINKGTNKKYDIEPYNSSSSSKSNSSKSSSSSSTDKALTSFQNWVKTIFDWIEVKLDRLARKTDNWISKAEQAVDYSRKSSYYKKAISSAGSELKENYRASNTYRGQALAIAQNAVNKGLISSSTMNSALKKIENGSINLQAYSDRQREAIENVKTWYEKSIKSKDNILSLIKDIDGYYEALENLPIDKATEKVDKLSDSFDILGAKLDNANSYKTQNKLLNQETKNIQQQASIQRSAAKQTQKSYNSAIRGVKGYNFGSYQKVVNKALANGEKITVLDSWNEGAIKTVTRYNNALKSNQEAQNTAAKATQEATKTLRENTKAKYDNISAYYADTNNVTSSRINKYETQLSYRNSMGYSATSKDQEKIYKNIISNDKSLLKSYQGERKKYNKNTLKKQYQSGKLSRSDYMAQLAYIEELDEKILKTKSDIADNQYELFNVKLTKYVNTLDNLEASATKIQDKISLNETKGIAANKSQYQSLVNNSKQQIKNLQSQNQLIKRQMSKYSVGSEKYRELKSQLDENNSQIIECKKSQEEWNQAILNMPINQLEKQLQLLDAIAEKNKSVVELKKSQGKNLSKEDYYRQIIDLNNQKKVQQKNVQLYKSYYQRALKSSNHVYNGKTAGEWKQLMLASQTEINNIGVAIEELRDELRDDVYWRTFNKAHDSAQKLQTVLEGISSLISDDMYFDKDGKMTQYGVAQIGSLVKQYENARQEVKNYSKDIKYLHTLYANGYYTQDEYNDKLNELQEGLLNSASSMKSYIENIKDMYKEMEQSELDALFKIIDARQKALTSKKDYYSFDKTISEKNKNIQSLNAELAALQGIETAEAKAQRAKLQAQLSEAQDDLNDTIDDHIMELSSQALDDLKTTLQDAFDDRWDNLFTNFENVAELLATANTLTQTQTNNISSVLSNVLRFYGIDGNLTGVMVSGGFSNGTKSVSRSGNYWTQENGGEVIIRPSDGAVLVPLKVGDGVLPANITENMLQWGVYDPEKFIQQMVGGFSVPNINNSNVNNVYNVYADQNFTVQGDMTKSTLPELKDILKMSSEYTQRQMVNEARKLGRKV